MNNEEKILAILATMQTDMADMKTNINHINTRLTNLETDVAVINTRLTSLETDVAVMKTDINHINTRLTNLEELHQETRTGVNKLLEWADACGYVVRFPLPKLQ